jgi:hypothetical protein
MLKRTALRLDRPDHHPRLPSPLWFGSALVPMVVSQIIRLQQSDPSTWVCWDYAGRVGALAVLAAIPSAQAVAFQRERLSITYWEAGSWIVGIVLFDHYVCGWIRRTVNAALPATVLGGYPDLHGYCTSSMRSLGWPLLPIARKSSSAAARATSFSLI